MDHFLLPFKKFLTVGSAKDEKKDKQPSAGQKRLSGNDHAVFNVFAPTWFGITVIGTLYFGLWVVLPILYKPDSMTLIINQVLTLVILIELVTNWCFLRCVKSPYRPLQEDKIVLDKIENAQNRLIEINKRKGINIDQNCGNVIQPSKATLSKKQVKNSAKSMSTANQKEEENTNIFCWSKIAVPEAKAPATKSATQSSVARAPRRQPYPYWCWKLCLECGCVRPPRAHHCPVCRMCVIKRDHHCFFSGTCVGLRNQRYFLVFLFWGTTACFFSAYQAMVYIYTIYLPDNSWLDIVLPIGAVKCLLGREPRPMHLAMLIIFYSILWFSINAAGFLCEQLRCVRAGKTMHEMDTGTKLVSQDIYHNFRSVFGSYWLLNFLLPLHWLWPQQEDGCLWTRVKVMD